MTTLFFTSVGRGMKKEVGIVKHVQTLTVGKLLNSSATCVTRKQCDSWSVPQIGTLVTMSMQAKLQTNPNSPQGTRNCNCTRNVNLRDIGLQLMQQTSPILNEVALPLVLVEFKRDFQWENYRCREAPWRTGGNIEKTHFQFSWFFSVSVFSSNHHKEQFSMWV